MFGPGSPSAGLLSFLLGISFIAAWLTHVVTCLSDDRWGFLIAGAIMFPIGIIHGIGIWFGAW